MKPLVVQCQETTDYSKLELKLACHVNKQRFQAQCAVDGSPWSTCVLFSTRKCPQRLVTRMFLSLKGSARIALNEYSAESHTMMISVIDDDGLTYNRTIQFRGATQPGTFGCCQHTGHSIHADRKHPLMIVHMNKLGLLHMNDSPNAGSLFLSHVSLK